MKHEQDIEKLQPGDQLVIIKPIGLLSGKPGDIVTFAKRYKQRAFQCREMLVLYPKHKIPLRAVERLRHLTPRIIHQETQDLIARYGR